MSTLTKKERLQVYRAMRRILVSEYDRFGCGYGFCRALRKAYYEELPKPIKEKMDKDTTYIMPFLNLKGLPELISLKPKSRKHEPYWYAVHNTKIRIKKLSEIIEAMEGKNKIKEKV